MTIATGRPKGRRPKLSDAEQRIVVARHQAWRKNFPMRICAEHGITKSTLHAYLRQSWGRKS